MSNRFLLPKGIGMKKLWHYKRHPPAATPSKVRTNNSTHAGNQYDDASRLLIRASLSCLLLFNGFFEVEGGQFVTRALSGTNIPEAAAKIIAIGELITLLMVLFGLWTRPAALAIAVNLAAAILLAHIDDIHLFWVRGDWALELQLLYFVLAIAVALQGAGRYSIGGSNGRWN